MNDSPSARHESVPPTLDQRVVEEFRQAWRDERQPAIEDYLPRAPIDERPALFRELLAIELRFRSERGETPNPDDYRTRFSDYADTVAEVFSGNTPSLDFDVHLSVTTDSQSAAQLTANHDQAAEARSFDSDRVLPSSFGRYAVINRLGGGGFGNVYLAFDAQLNRRVAIKVPRAERFSKPGSREQFLLEARTAAALDHPGIVKVHDVGQADNGAPFVVFEFIEGKSLESLLKEARPTFERTANLIAQVAEAVHFAHKKGFVHRDLKPANILLDAAGKPKIADFGLAYHDAEWRRRMGDISGTAPYMSPEQVEGRTNDIDGRTDVWSLGVIVYQMLTGRLPFAGATRDATFDEIRNRSVKPPRQFDESIPVELETICCRCLERSVSERYSCANDVVVHLRAWLGHPVGSSRIRTAIRHHKRRIILLTSAVLLFIALAFLFWPPFEGPALVFGRWQDLPYGKPRVVFCKDPNCSQFAWDGSTRQLRIESCAPYLVRLGRTTHPHFRIQAGIQQHDWHADAGLFFGHQTKIGDDGETIDSYQAIEITRNSQSGTFAVAWSVCEFVRKSGRAVTDQRTVLWDVPIEPLFGDKQEHVLDVVFDEAGLRSVHWDNRRLDGLDIEHKLIPIQTQHDGSFGVLNYSGVSLFQNVRFMALE